MKFTQITKKNQGQQFTIAVALILGISLQGANAAVTALDLDTAESFAVLAGAGITVAAPVNSTVITGDIGTFPTTTISGLGNVVLNGVNHAGDGVTQQAKIDLVSTYGDAVGRTPDVIFPLVHNIGGLTFESGVYKAPSSLAITGVVTLDGLGDPNAVWIFQMFSTLTTASSSKVNLINGAQASNVFWQVGSSATIGTSTDFKGTIIALDSITLTNSATIAGRALALNGAVTMDNNIVAIPETGSSVLSLLGFALTALTRRREMCRV